MLSIWVSSDIGTCQVDIDDDDRVVKTCALWRVFEGQPFANLINWLSNRGRERVRITTLQTNRDARPCAATAGEPASASRTG